MRFFEYYTRLTGIEPAFLPPEGNALSVELQAQGYTTNCSIADGHGFVK